MRHTWSTFVEKLLFFSIIMGTRQRRGTLLKKKGEKRNVAGEGRLDRHALEKEKMEKRDVWEEKNLEGPLKVVFSGKSHRGRKTLG